MYGLHLGTKKRSQGIVSHGSGDFLLRHFNVFFHPRETLQRVLSIRRNPRMLHDVLYTSALLWIDL